ncbi:MAG TPA: hypothetical protein VG206_11070 [Terriglobia bacterium]|nr:hypothetical protein [Terriglobia bacterium]
MRRRSPKTQIELPSSTDPNDRIRKDPAPAGNSAQDGEEVELPDGYSYTSDDPLHGKITTRLKEIVARIFDDARQDPEGEANQMVRAMLLNQVANMQPKSYQGNPGMLLAEERRRGAEHERQAELDTHNFRILTLRAKDLEHKVREKEQQIAKTQRELERAQEALEHGQPIDARAVYRRISEIVGLRAPSEAGQQATQ